MWVEGTNPTDGTSTPPPPQRENGADVSPAPRTHASTSSAPEKPLRGATPAGAGFAQLRDLVARPQLPREPAPRRAAPTRGVRRNNWFSSGDGIDVVQQQPASPKRQQQLASPERQQHGGFSPGGSSERLYPIYQTFKVRSPTHQQRLGSPAVSEYDEPAVVGAFSWPEENGAAPESISCGLLADNNWQAGFGSPMRMIAPPQGARFTIRMHGKWCVPPTGCT
jgi:hypothetical protein